MDLNLKGKAVIVTGGARGIGLAIAEAFGREGCRVVIADRDGADHAAAQLRGEGTDATGVVLDVADQTSIDDMVASVLASHGRIHILCNVAGIFTCAPLLEFSRSDWDATFDVNATGLFFTLQAVARQMVSQGEGNIINIASVAGRRADGFAAAYSASKAAVISITQSAALALVGQGVRVNAIAPGQVETDLWTALDADMSRIVLNQGPGAITALAKSFIPMGRMAAPNEIVGAALFLASGMSGFVVGQTINVDGGLMLN